MKKTIFEIVSLTVQTIFFLIIGFVFVEPAVSLGAQNTLLIGQTVTSEVAFSATAANITLTPSLNASTGGTADGGTQVIVATNNSLGYLMTITASSSVGMIGIASTTNSIPAYVPATPGLPDYVFTVPANTAYFGYTVEASTTADLATSFKDAAGACNSVGGGDTAESCWLNASTTAYTIVNRGSQTVASGATTTLKFRVVINANPSPIIPNDTYRATTTLTATAN